MVRFHRAAKCVTAASILQYSFGNLLRRGHEPIEHPAVSALVFDESYLDAASLARFESQILQSSFHQHRALQQLNCMDDIYSGAAGCAANDLEFIRVTGVQVYDSTAYLENGIWKDACLGKDDYVNISFTADIKVSNDRYDVGMCKFSHLCLFAIVASFFISCVLTLCTSPCSDINTEGGSAYTGTCALSLLSTTNFKKGAVAPEIHVTPTGTVTIGELETKNAGPDYCPDFSGAGTLKDFAFAPVRFYVFGNAGDGLVCF